MKDFWRRIGGPDSINWLSFAVTYPVLLVINIIGSGVDLQGRYFDLVLASSTGAGALFAVLLIAKIPLTKLTKRKSRTWLTLLVFLLALIARAYGFDEMLLALGLETEPRFGYRFLGSLTTVGFTLITMAYIMSLARDYTRQLQQLRATNEKLRETKRNIDAKIKAKRDDVVGSVRAQLEEGLRALTGASAKQALRKVRDTIEEVVRPISHELAKQVTNLSESEPIATADSVRWRRVFVESTATQPFRPFLFSFWTGVATACFAPIEWGLDIGVTLSFVTSLVAYAVLSAWAYLWPRVMTKASTPTRAIVFTALLFITAMIDSFATSKVSNLEELAKRGALPLGWLWIILGWGIAIIPSIQKETLRVVESLGKASRQLREELVRLNTAYRLQQQAIARALHGPIQDALSVAAFKLSAAIKADTATPELISELNEQILGTLVLLDGNEENVPALEHSLTDLSEFWDGVARISWRISPSAKRLIDSHPVTSATAFELIREGCSNAVRHGKARSIKVVVGSNRDEKTLEISVTNNGKLVKMQTEPGLGSRLMNELALRWSLRSEGELTILEIVTPVI